MSDTNPAAEGGNGSLNISSEQGEMAPGVQSWAEIEQSVSDGDIDNFNDLDVEVDKHFKNNPDNPVPENAFDWVGQEDDDEEEDEYEDDDTQSEEDLEDDDDFEEDSEEESEESDEEETELSVEDIFDLEFELKVNGEQKTVDGRNFVRLAQKGMFAEQELQKARETEAQVNQTLKLIADKDPNTVFGVLEALGHDVKGLINTHVQQQLQLNKMTPEQKQMYQRQQELRRREQEVQQAEAQKKQKAMQKQQSARLQQLGKELDTKLAESNLSDPMIHRAVVQELQAQKRYGLDLDVDAAISTVRDEMEKMSTSALKKLSDEALDELVGEKERKRLRSRTKKVKQKNATKDLPTSTSTERKKKRRTRKNQDPMALWKQLNDLG